jgi:UPF0716 family protein affecting phage T7 exclusion
MAVDTATRATNTTSPRYHWTTHLMAAGVVLIVPALVGGFVVLHHLFPQAMAIFWTVVAWVFMGILAIGVFLVLFGEFLWAIYKGILSWVSNFRWSRD